MIRDKLNTFSEAQAVTASAASADVLDLGPLAAGNTSRDIGAGEPIYLVVSVSEAAAAAGAATVNFQLQTDVAEGFGTAKTLFDSGAIGKAALTLGARPVAIAVPRGVQRYLRLNYVVGTGPLTAGKFHAFLTKDVQDDVKFAAGYSV